MQQLQVSNELLACCFLEKQMTDKLRANPEKILQEKKRVVITIEEQEQGFK